MAQKAYHPLKVGRGVGEEHAIGFAKIVQPLWIAFGCGQEPMFRTTAMTGKAPFAPFAGLRKPGLFIEPELPLLR